MLNKVTLTLSILSVVVFFAGALLANREIVPPRIGMLLLVIGALLGIAAVCCSMAVLFITQSFPVAMVGVLGALPLIAGLTALVDVARYPPINDITTDTQNVPQFVHAASLPANAGRDLSFPDKNAKIIADAYAGLQPIVLDLPPAEAYRLVLREAGVQVEWEITHEDEASGVFEGVSTTRVMHWRDDFVVRVQAEGEGMSRVDMRSKSRDGKSDLGANARRIDAFLLAVKARAATR